MSSRYIQSILLIKFQDTLNEIFKINFLEIRFHSSIKLTSLPKNMREGKEKNIRELTLIRMTRGMITIKLICPMHASQYDFCQNRSGSWFLHRRSIDSSAIKSFSSTSARWKISRHSFCPSRNHFHDLNGRQDGKEKIRLFF